MIIEEASNGWIVRYTTTSEVVDIVEYDELDEEFSENHAKSIQKLLYTIMEGLELYNSKHNKYRVNVEIEKQLNN